MNPLDDELKAALARREPSADFTRRVMQRIETAGREKAARRSWWAGFTRAWRVPALRWAASAMACVALAAGIVEYRRYQRVKAEGEMARAQVMLALEIASNKLNVALAPVEQVEDHDAQRPASGSRRRTEPKGKSAR